MDMLDILCKSSVPNLSFSYTFLDILDTSTGH
jgi:hypothetical protein